MTKEMKPSFMSMGILEILKEAFKIPSRNGKLALSLALLLLIPSSLLFLANDFALIPFFKDLFTKVYLLKKTDPESPEYAELLAGIGKDSRIIAGEELIFIIAYSILSLFSTVATVYASAMTYSGNHLTLNELLSRIGKTWKSPVITWLYITLFSFGYLFLFVVLIVFFVMIGLASNSIALAALGVILVLVLFVIRYCFNFIVVWTLGLVISIIEEGCYGIEALSKAKELLKGRRLQASVLLFILTIIPMGISQIFVNKMSDVNNTEATRIVLGLVLINISGLFSLYSLGVYTVFYYECKKSHEEEVEVKGVMGYSMLPASDVPNAYIP
ncbi:uncharacterized protein LOC143878718 [Tasmannia lanceolata]|uniref:uncharacterized protein LOC143878718 n=1 Tax=Tasmannia lanceolata TaxID=3420 RepID=UPI0040641525